MNKYLGFNGHRYGDLFINLAACRVLKRADPYSHLTFVINKDYRNAAPLFLDQPDIDSIYITDNNVGGFNQNDLKWVGNRPFNHIFNPLQDHDHGHPWWLQGRNQPQECVFMHGLPYYENEIGKLNLKRWFEPNTDFQKYVALQAFAGSYDSNNKKQLTIEKAQQIVDLVVSKGYKVLQLGISKEPKLENTIRLNIDFFSEIKNLLGCKALITTDSGFSWAASCYDFPTLGLYSHSYYGKENVKAIQPINPNAIYLDELNVNDISLDTIEKSLMQLL